jgi:hypothetical protein
MNSCVTRCTAAPALAPQRGCSRHGRWRSCHCAPQSQSPDAYLRPGAGLGTSEVWRHREVLTLPLPQAPPYPLVWSRLDRMLVVELGDGFLRAVEVGGRLQGCLGPWVVAPQHEVLELASHALRVDDGLGLEVVALAVAFERLGVGDRCLNSRESRRGVGSTARGARRGRRCGA